MARYGIATLFEDYPDRHEFTEANTPLHLTHVDVLNIDLEPDKFIGISLFSFWNGPEVVGIYGNH